MFVKQGIESTRPIFKTDILSYRPKAILGAEILFGKINLLLEQKIKKEEVRDECKKQQITFDSGP